MNTYIIEISNDGYKFEFQSSKSLREFNDFCADIRDYLAAYHPDTIVARIYDDEGNYQGRINFHSDSRYVSSD